MECKLIKSTILRMNNSLRPFPTLFFFPGIRSSPFWKSNELKSVKILQENYPIIKKEYIEANENKYFQLENDYKLRDHEHSLHKGNWEWSSYISKGTKQDSFKNVFPLTHEILESIDDKIIDLPFSYCFFSRLAPSSSISAHYGPCNIRLRIHLALDIPDNCFIRVAEQETKWEEGKCLVFDDTYLHEVQNNNKSRNRSILLLDIWHPDINIEEKEAIINMFKGAYDKGWLKK